MSSQNDETPQEAHDENGKAEENEHKTENLKRKAEPPVMNTEKKPKFEEEKKVIQNKQIVNEKQEKHEQAEKDDKNEEKIEQIDKVEVEEIQQNELKKESLAQEKVLKDAYDLNKEEMPNKSQQNNSNLSSQKTSGLNQYALESNQNLGESYKNMTMNPTVMVATQQSEPMKSVNVGNEECYRNSLQAQQGQQFASFPNNSEIIRKVENDTYVVEINVPDELKFNPRFNFVGMMIGPGGYTQRQMEQATNCSITVRGAGSSRTNQIIDPHREMYVHLKSYSLENCKIGYQLVYGLLHDQNKRDALRQQQLAMRTAQLSSAMVNTPQGVLQMTSGTERTPYHNAFDTKTVAPGIIELSVIIPIVKAKFFSTENNGIEEIQYYSGAKLSLIDRSGNNMQMNLVIRGSKEQVDLARTKANEIFMRDENEIVAQAKDFIFIPNSMVGLIIGKNGETIKKLMSQSRCQMRVVPEYLTDPNLTERKIVLFGNPEECENSKISIRHFVEQHISTVHTIKSGSVIKVEVCSVPCGCIGILIGKGGETIRGLGKRANCRVQVVQYDENQLFPGGVIKNQNMRHVSLKGDHESIKRAKIEIQSIIDEHAHRHKYDAPQMNVDNGDSLIGLEKDQYEKYIQQMKTYCNMDREQVHQYYHSVMSQIAKEPAEYAALVKQYLTRAQQAAYGQVVGSQAQTVPPTSMAQPLQQPGNQNQGIGQYYQAGASYAGRQTGSMGNIGNTGNMGQAGPFKQHDGNPFGGHMLQMPTGTPNNQYPSNQNTQSGLQYMGGANQFPGLFNQPRGSNYQGNNQPPYS